MFKFENIMCSENGLELSGRCRIDPDQAFFKGHFDHRPLMPAVAQLLMLEALVQTQKSWQIHILGGQNIKFLQRIIPDDVVSITLTRQNAQSIRFKVCKQDKCLASTGLLICAGDKFE